jgi:hypothetical protein
MLLTKVTRATGKYKVWLQWLCQAADSGGGGTLLSAHAPLRESGVVMGDALLVNKWGKRCGVLAGDEGGEEL